MNNRTERFRAYIDEGIRLYGLTDIRTRICRDLCELSCAIDALKSNPAPLAPAREPDAPGEGDEAMVKAATVIAEGVNIRSRPVINRLREFMRREREVLGSSHSPFAVDEVLLKQAEEAIQGAPSKSEYIANLLAFARQHRPTASDGERTLWRERLDLMHDALRSVLRKAGVLNRDTDPSGPELLMAAESFVASVRAASGQGVKMNQHDFDQLTASGLAWHSVTQETAPYGKESHCHSIERQTAAGMRGSTIVLDLTWEQVSLLTGEHNRSIISALNPPPGEAGKAADATLIPPSLTEWDSPPSAPTGGTVAAIGDEVMRSIECYQAKRWRAVFNLCRSLGMSPVGDTEDPVLGFVRLLASRAGTTGKVRIVVPQLWEEARYAINTLRRLNPHAEFVTEGAAAAGEGEQK